MRRCVQNTWSSVSNAKRMFPSTIGLKASVVWWAGRDCVVFTEAVEASLLLSDQIHTFIRLQHLELTTLPEQMAFFTQAALIPVKIHTNMTFICWSTPSSWVILLWLSILQREHFFLCQHTILQPLFQVMKIGFCMLLANINTSFRPLQRESRW